MLNIISLYRDLRLHFWNCIFIGQVFSTEEREEDQDEDMDTTEANESENEEDQQAEEHSSDEVSRDANLNFSVICHC